LSITTIADLKPDDKNANRGNVRGTGMLEESLRKFGAGRSILIDKNNRVIAGNKTLEGAASIGLEDVQIVESDGTRLIAVKRTDLDLDDPKTRELAIHDNRVGQVNLEWDAAVLAELAQEGVNLDHLWSEDELTALLADVAGAPAPLLGDPDEIPEVVETRCKPGDLWKLGEHRLQCGDSTKAEDVARLMCGGRAVCMWTDPPYGVSIVGGNRRQYEAERIAERGKSATIQNDTKADLPELLYGAFSLAGEVLEPGAPYYCARPPGEHSFLFADAIRKLGWKLHQELQWVKGNMVLGHSDYHLKHETIMYGWIPGPGRSGRGNHEGSRWFGDNSQTSVMELPLGESPDHPSMKPVALLVAHLTNSTPVGGAVYDPFLGSGTTLIACEQLGRRCYGMEVDPHYCDVILTRWENATGKTAERMVKADPQYQEAAGARPTG
jgi:DNA modification methylase